MKSTTLRSWVKVLATGLIFWNTCYFRAAFAAEPPPAFKPRILSDGQPDFQGFWKPENAGAFSLYNPRHGLCAWPDANGRALPRGPDGRIPAKEVKPSRIIDPPGGAVPYLPEAAAHQRDLLVHFEDPIAPQYVEGQARCFPSGVSRQQWTTSLEIRQYPGLILMLSPTSTRVIYLDGRPHIPAAIKLWNSDSRGHWEGPTLIVDVKNSNSKHRLSNEGDFASDQVHIVERFTILDANTYTYTATYEDPSVYSQPWTVFSKQVRDHLNEPDWEWWEYSCHEGDREFDSLAPH